MKSCLRVEVVGGLKPPTAHPWIPGAEGPLPGGETRTNIPSIRGRATEEIPDDRADRARSSCAGHTPGDGGQAWRAHERRWRQDPADLDALGRAIAGLRRSGLVVPPDLLDARVEPATRLETALPLEVWAVLPGEREPTTVGWGPGTIEVPPHRYWGVGDVPAGRPGLGWLGDELRRRGIPGLRLLQLAPSRRRTVAGRGDDDPHLDEDGLAALGPQPQLRWLDLPRRGVQWVTPGEVVRALRCAGLEVFRGEFLVGDGRADEDGEDLGPRLEGFEELRRLREVELTDCELAASDLRALAGLEELTSLELLGNEGLGLAALDRPERLTRLALQAERLDEAELDRLRGLAALRELRLCADLTDGLCLSLSTLTELRELALQGTFDRAATTRALGAFAERLRLESLSLEGSVPLEAAGLAAIAAMPLTSLHARCADEALGPAGLGPLAGLRSLSLGVRDWSTLPPLPALRHLTAAAVWPTPGAAFRADSLPEHLARAPLASLRSELGPLSAGTERAIAGADLSALQVVELPASVAGALAERGRLTSLGVRAWGEEPDLAARVARIGSLESLTLDAAVDDAALGELRSLGALRRLCLSARGGLTPDGVLATLRTLPGLRRLSLGSDLDERLKEAIRSELPWVGLVDAVF